MKSTAALLIGLMIVALMPTMPGEARAEGPIAAADNSESPQQRDRRMAWWREGRFGLFLHFGIFSLPTEEPRRMDKYFKLPDSEFVEFSKRFNAPKYNPDEWVRLAKAAGMKYVVFVTKSHDGWCTFDSQHTDFDVTSTPHKRDLLKPLAEACHREGLKMCWYYSIMDWHHRDYLPKRKVDPPAPADADMDRYVATMKSQLRELVTGYGPIGVLWFDGDWDATWTPERGLDLYRYVRGLQPDIIINDRVGKRRWTGPGEPRLDGDFDTPEQEIFGAARAGDWESCMTMNHHWQYIDYDQDYKSPATLVHMLVDCASRGGNFLLDVGPKPDGTFPQPAVERLERIGRWMQVNGESIYGTGAGPFLRLSATAKPLPDGRTRLYLHLFDWPSDGKLLVPYLRNEVSGARLLADPKATPLDVSRAGDDLTIALPKTAPDEIDSVVVLDVKGAPDVVPSGIPPGTDGRFVLLAKQAEIHGRNARCVGKPGNESVGAWTDAGTWVSWPVDVKQPGQYRIELVYGCADGQGGSRYQVEAAGQTLSGAIRQTGGWGNKVTETLGTVRLPKAPLVTIAVRPQSKPGHAVMDLFELRLVPVADRQGGASARSWAPIVLVGEAAAPEDRAHRGDAAPAKPAAFPNPKLFKLPFSFGGMKMENTPVIYKGRPLLVQNWRSTKAEEQDKAYLFIEDLVTGREVARLGTGFSFVSGLVNGDEMNVFGTVNTNRDWTGDVYRFRSTDLKTWKQERVITRDGDEHLFNTSVCRDEQGYVMAYESNKPVQWSFRFARSKDLSHWEKVRGLEFADVQGRTACANPTIRYFAPYYYVVYGIWRWKGPGAHYEYLLPQTKYVTAVARSKDLATWEVSPTKGPLLDPIPGEGINNTDADLFEFEGNTYIYYATGDQATWGTIRVAMYAGPMKQMLQSCFPEGVRTITFDARKRAYSYPQ